MNNNFQNFYQKNKIVIFSFLSIIILAIVFYFIFWNNPNNKIFAIGMSGTPKHFDPQSSAYNQGTVVDSRFYTLIHEPLMTKDPLTKALQDNLCQSKKLNATDNSYEFTLKPKVQFHNGEILKPSDVKFTIERAQKKFKDPETGNIICSVFQKFNLNNSTFDDKNNSFKLSYNNEYDINDMLEDLTSVYILNQKACEADNEKGPQIGLGRLQMKDWRDSERNITLKKFGNYFQGELASLKDIDVIKIIGADRSQYNIKINECKNGDISLLLDVPSDKAQEELSQSPQESSINVISYNKPFYLTCLWFNSEQTPIETRKLINQTLNMKKICQTLNIGVDEDSVSGSNNVYLIPKSFIYHSDLVGFDKNIKSIDYPSVDQIKASVKKLDSKQKQLNFYIRPLAQDDFSRIFLEMQKSLELVGFKVKITPLPEGQFGLQYFQDHLGSKKTEAKQTIFADEQNIACFSELLTENDPSPAFAYFAKDAEFNSALNFKNDEFQKIYQTLNTKTVPKGFSSLNTKANKIKELNNILLKELPIIPFLAVRKNFYLKNKNTNNNIVNDLKYFIYK